jgi:hypothetical protein
VRNDGKSLIIWLESFFSKKNSLNLIRIKIKLNLTIDKTFNDKINEYFNDQKRRRTKIKLRKCRNKR